MYGESETDVSNSTFLKSFPQESLIPMAYDHFVSVHLASDQMFSR
jgi:hypothetical protein